MNQPLSLDVYKRQADGCVIEGTVENCVLFRGVKVKKGAVVKNCVLMQDKMCIRDRGYDKHTELQNYVKTLNAFYKEHPAFWQIDYSWEGFQWIVPVSYTHLTMQASA